MSWAIPSCISRASRRRSSAVAASRNEAKSMAVSRWTAVASSRAATSSSRASRSTTFDSSREETVPLTDRDDAGPRSSAGGRTRCRTTAGRFVLPVASARSWSTPVSVSAESVLDDERASARRRAGTCTTSAVTGSSSRTASAIVVPSETGSRPERELPGDPDPVPDEGLGRRGPAGGGRPVPASASAQSCDQAHARCRSRRPR